jgi:HPt (histidine-containing phosphotransfer) domain-containing protein
MVDLELDELRREFLAEAEEKVREIESRLEEESREARDRLIYLAHQLKGSGGSYGFQRISTDAAELEKAVEALSAGSVDGLREKMRSHVGNLRAEIDRAMQELG